jgi:hypothetical protein
MNPFAAFRRVSSYLDGASFCCSLLNSAHLTIRLQVEIPTDEALYRRLPMIRKDLV